MKNPLKQSNAYTKRLDALSNNKPYVKTNGIKVSNTKLISPTAKEFRISMLQQNQSYLKKKRTASLTNAPTNTNQVQTRLYKIPSSSSF